MPGIGFSGVVDYANVSVGSATRVMGVQPSDVGSFGVSTLQSQLALIFNGATTLDPRITFTRASTATYYNSAGVLTTAAVNEARIDYSPVTLAVRGLLIEEARTNLVTYSEQFDNAAWTKARSTITANAVIAPDGTTTADAYTEDTATGVHTLFGSSISYVSGDTYTFSVIAKPNGRFLQLGFNAAAFGGSNATNAAVFDLTLGTRIIGGALTSAVIEPVGSGWFRCSITKTATATIAAGNYALIALRNAYSIDVATGYTGDGVSGVYLWGAQVEAGAFDTSYIPTVASQVTRAADVATMTGTNFSSWYNQTEGTFVTEFQGVTTAGVVCSANDGTNAERVQIALGSGSGGNINMTVTDGNVAQATVVNPITVTARTKQAASYKLNDFAASANGAAVVTDAAGTLPTPDRLTIGMSGLSIVHLNGWIKSIDYFVMRLPNATDQGLSAL